jgi:hypothetical protein
MTIATAIRPSAHDEAAPHEQAAERDDERRDEAVGDDEPLQEPHAQAEDDSQDDGRDPDDRVPEAESEGLRQPRRLGHRHGVADEPEHRPDGEVDIARHDDQHHPGRHDRDRGALDGQVPQVPSGQERSAGGDVEADPDDRQRGEEADEPRVDVGCASECSATVRQLPQAVAHAESGGSRGLGHLDSYWRALIEEALRSG